MPHKPVIASRNSVPRWPLSDILSLLSVEYRASYTPKQLAQRHDIITFRAKVNFHSDFAPGGSWFNPDKAQAFSNLNQGSYLFSERLKPLQKLSTNSFLVGVEERANLAGDKIASLAKTIGNKLIPYLKQLPSWQYNDVYHYYFHDVQRILVKISRTADILTVKESLEKLHQYMKDVELTMSPTDPLRLFNAELIDDIDSSLMPRVESIIESGSIVDMMKKQHFQIGELLEEMSAIETSAYRLDSASAHANYLLTSEEAIPSHQALLECVERTTGELVVRKSKEQGIENPLYRQEGNTIEPDVSWLDLCKPGHLITSLSHQERLDYLRAADHINKLNQYRSKLLDLIKAVEHHGELTASMYFDSDIQSHFEGLMRELKASSATFERLSKANRDYKLKFLGQLSAPTSRMNFFANLFSEKDMSAKRFIENQDNLEKIMNGKRVIDAINGIKGSLQTVATKFSQLSRLIANGDERERMLESVINLRQNITSLVGESRLLYPEIEVNLPSFASLKAIEQQQEIEETVVEVELPLDDDISSSEHRELDNLSVDEASFDDLVEGVSFDDGDDICVNDDAFDGYDDSDPFECLMDGSGNNHIPVVMPAEPIIPLYQPEQIAAPNIPLINGPQPYQAQTQYTQMAGQAALGAVVGYMIYRFYCWLTHTKTKTGEKKKKESVKVNHRVSPKSPKKLKSVPLSILRGQVKRALASLYDKTNLSEDDFNTLYTYYENLAKLAKNARLRKKPSIEAIQTILSKAKVPLSQLMYLVEIWQKFTLNSQQKLEETTCLNNYIKVVMEYEPQPSEPYTENIQESDLAYLKANETIWTIDSESSHHRFFKPVSKDEEDLSVEQLATLNN